MAVDIFDYFGQDQQDPEIGGLTTADKEVITPPEYQNPALLTNACDFPNNTGLLDGSGVCKYTEICNVKSTIRAEYSIYRPFESTAACKMSRDAGAINGKQIYCTIFHVDP